MVCNIFSNLNISTQLVRPERRTALNFYSYHWQHKSCNVVPTVIVLRCVLPVNQPLVRQCIPNLFSHCCQPVFASRVARANFFVSNDERGVWQCETHHKFGTKSQSSRRQQMWNSFVPSIQGFMPFERPVNARQRAHNGSANFSKPRFACVPGKWYGFHLQGTHPMKQQNQNSGDAEK